MDFVAQHFETSRLALEAACTSATLLDSVRRATEACVKCYRDGGKIMVAGNGGSAGDAQHISGEFLSRLNFDRPPMAAIALSTDISVLTAVGNDYGFEQVFERQIVGLARPGDVFIAISTSGRSPNIIAALKAARQIGCVTIGFAGEGSPMAPLCDICIEAPSRSTPIIQQIYMIVAHALCGAVERDIWGDHRSR